MPPRSFDRGGHSRRQFLTRAGLIAAGGPAFLAACARQPTTTSTVDGAQPLKLASPSSPVKWQINEKNQPIADGLKPERNATLRIYSYENYLDPAAISSFEQKYSSSKVKTEVTTFGDLDEALTKIRQGTLPFDIWVGSGYDLTARLVTTSLIRPLNHSYLPNIKNVWPAFQNPWYDQEWQYTVPYTVYSTGLAWRTDMVPEDAAARENPWETLWDGKYRGKTAILDDYRSTIEMCLLREGITDVNTGDAAQLDRAGRALTELAKATAPKVTINQYQDLSKGAYGQSAMWSGDVINTVSDYYRPKGVSPSIFRYWFEKDGVGMVDNDLLLVLRGGQNPVLSHLFLDHMLDAAVAEGNFGFTGYQIPQVTFVPDTLVDKGFIPENLASAIVREEDFKTGLPALELSTETQDAWHNIWLAFKAGN